MPRGARDAGSLASVDVAAVRKAVRALVDECLSAAPPADYGAASGSSGSAARRLLARRLLEPYVVEAYHLRIAKAVRSMVRKHDGSPRGATEACLVEKDSAGRKKIAIASAGQGAYGKVYRMDRRRAAKLVRIQGEGFEREATITRRAGELGVGPRVHDVFSCCNDEGECYAVIVMDGLHITLSDWMRSAAGVHGAARDRMRDAIDAKLRRMHRAGIYHNDLHNDNIMLSDRGEPFIIDYGLASEGAEESHNDRKVLRDLAPDPWEARGSDRRPKPSSDGSYPLSVSERDAEKLHDLVTFVVRRLAARVMPVGAPS